MYSGSVLFVNRCVHTDPINIEETATDNYVYAALSVSPPPPPSLDLGDIDAVLREFDTVIYENSTPENMLALVDGTSLLWRLNLLGIDPGEKRWERLTESCAKLVGNHGLAWLVALKLLTATHVTLNKSDATEAIT